MWAFRDTETTRILTKIEVPRALKRHSCHLNSPLCRIYKATVIILLRKSHVKLWSTFEIHQRLVPGRGYDLVSIVAALGMIWVRERGVEEHG